MPGCENALREVIIAATLGDCGAQKFLEEIMIDLQNEIASDAYVNVN